MDISNVQPTKITKLLASLFSRITHATFNNSFNKPILALPETLTHLTFGDYFNQQVNYLPQNLVYIEFGRGFNRSTKHLGFIKTIKLSTHCYLH